MKRFYLITLGYFLWFAGFSQPQQTFQWGVKAGGAGDDRVGGIASIGNNLYVTGQFGNQFSSGTKTADGIKSGIFLVRLDEKGNTDWVQTLQGSENNTATRICAMGQSILTGGTSQGTIDSGKNSITGNGQSLFVSSWSEKGQMEWVSQMAYQGFATFDVLEPTSQGNILIGGMFEGTIKTQGGELLSETEKRAYLVALQANGTPQKCLMSTGKGSHRLVSATTSGDGSHWLLFSITGDFGFGGIPAAETPRAMENGLALVKTNSAGDAQWIKYITGEGYLEGIKILAMPTGDVMICADYSGRISINNLIRGSNERTEAALWLFSPDGDFKKACTLYSPISVRALDALVTPDGNVLMTGYFRQEYTTGKEEIRPKLSRSDIFLLKADANLEVVWHDEPTRDALSFAKSFTLDHSGNIVLAGAFSGQLDIAGQKLASAGENDILVARYYNCLQKKAAILGNPFVCEGGKTELNVSGDYNSYIWNGQWGQSSLTVKQPGRYTVMAYDRTGCAAVDTIDVKTLPKTGLDLPENITVTPGLSVVLSPAEGFSAYHWSDGKLTPQREVLYCEKCDSFKLSLTAITENGCETTDTVKIKFAAIPENAAGIGQAVKFWPNPVSDFLYWTASRDGDYLVALWDDNGRTIYQENLKSYRKNSVRTISTTKMTSGAYLLSVRSEGVLYNFKVMKK